MPQSRLSFSYKSLSWAACLSINRIALPFSRIIYVAKASPKNFIGDSLSSLTPAILRKESISLSWFFTTDGSLSSCNIVGLWDVSSPSVTAWISCFSGFSISDFAFSNFLRTLAVYGSTVTQSETIIGEKLEGSGINISGSFLSSSRLSNSTLFWMDSFFESPLKTESFSEIFSAFSTGFAAFGW